MSGTPNPKPSAIGARQARVVFTSPELSLAAKGLLAMLLLHPAGLARQAIFAASSDAMPVIDQAVSELVAAGLVERVPASTSASTSARRRDRAQSRVRLAQPSFLPRSPAEPEAPFGRVYGRSGRW
jgi:hypothetical protein